MSKEFKADHFKNIEELLDTIKIWLENEELYGTLYDDFNRFFDTGAMEEMYYYIKDLQQRIDKVIKYIENHSLYEEEYDYDYEENSYLSGIDDEVAKKDLLEILKGEDK